MGALTYYIYGLKLDVDSLGVSRRQVVEALRAEGVCGLASGYQNLHLLPMFEKKIAYGSGGFPWTSQYCDSSVEYKRGSCPVAEELHSKSFIGLNACMYDFSDQEVDAVVGAFRKVWRHMDDLRGLDAG